MICSASTLNMATDPLIDKKKEKNTFFFRIDSFSKKHSRMFEQPPLARRQLASYYCVFLPNLIFLDGFLILDHSMTCWMMLHNLSHSAQLRLNFT